jgi:membrane protease YdiL (CAAX protease family)
MNQLGFRARNPLIAIFWGFGLFILMHVSQYLGLAVALMLSGASYSSLAKGEFVNHLSIFGHGVTQFIIGIPLAFVIINRLWRRDWSWLRLKFNGKMIILGLFAGMLMPILILLILSLLGVVNIMEYPDRLSLPEILLVLVGYLGYCLFVGVVEETVFRGMIAREIAVRYGWVVAAVISSLLFGIVHLGNLDAISFSNIMPVLIAGAIFGTFFLGLYLRSKSLWLPITFHAGWNFALHALVGTKVSGRTGYGLFETELTGNAILTGGSFGIEISLVTMITGIVAIVLILKLFRRKQDHLLASK